MWVGQVMSASNAAEVEIISAQLDGTKKNILVNVSYYTGCGEHEFSLETKGCFRIKDQLECHAVVIHKSENICEMDGSQTLSFPLSRYGYNKTELSGAKLTIFGTWDHRKQALSSVSMYLPTYR